MVRNVVRAMLVAFYSLMAVALIVDSGRGLPEGFPFLDRIRGLRAHFGGANPATETAALPPVHHEVPPGIAPPGRPAGSERVRVNRGLP